MADSTAVKTTTHQSLGGMVASFLNRLRHDTSGATAVEYGLVVALITIAMISALWGVAEESTRMWSEVESRTVEAIEN